MIDAYNDKTFLINAAHNAKKGKLILSKINVKLSKLIKVCNLNFSIKCSIHTS